MHASHTLQNGIELIYLHTTAHQAALALYLLSLEGNLIRKTSLSISSMRLLKGKEDDSANRRKEECKRD